MSEQELREKIARWLYELSYPGIEDFAWEKLSPDEQEVWLRHADQTLALIKEAGWIDPATVVMPGEFGTPKAAEMLHEWATANGYVKLVEANAIKDAECRARVKRIFQAIEEHKGFCGQFIMTFRFPPEEWQTFKRQVGVGNENERIS